MSVLANILHTSRGHVQLAIQELEQVTGYQGIDAHMVADIRHEVLARAKDLQLDSEFTSTELYYALLLRYKEDNDRFGARLDLPTDARREAKTQALTAFLEDVHIPRRGWFLRHGTMRRLLKQMPPRHIMKYLGYTRFDQMLKQEDIDMLFGAIRFAEPPDWLAQFVKQYKQLGPGDFEERDVRIISYPHERWEELSSSFTLFAQRYVTHLKEAGLVLLLPTPEDKPTLLHQGAMAVRDIFEARSYSAFFKLSIGSPKFSHVLYDSIWDDAALIAATQHHGMPWRDFHKQYGSSLDKEHPSVLSPHLQPEDIAWRQVENVLSDMDGRMRFWSTCHYAAHIEDSEVLSLNILDVARNAIFDLPLEQATCYYVRDALWGELMRRYLGESIFEQLVFERLQGQLSPAVSDSSSPQFV